MPEINPVPTNIAQSRAVQLLRSLTAAEIRSIKSFAGGDYFCKDPKVRGLLSALANQYPAFPEKALDKQKIFARLCKGQRFSTASINDLLSKVVELIEQFITIRELEKDPLQANRYLIQRAAAGTDERLFEGAVNRFAKAYAAVPESPDKLYQRFRVRQLQWSHWASIRHQPGPEMFRLLQAAHAEYDRVARLILASEARMRAQLLAEKPLDQVGAPTSPLTRLWEQLYALTGADAADETFFVACLQSFQDAFDYLHTDIQRDTLVSLINFCNRHSPVHPAYKHHLANLFHWALRQPDAFTRRWLQSEDSYLNTALGLGQSGDLAAMEAFIAAKADLLPVTVRDDAQTLASAYLYYFKRAFGQADEQVGKLLGKRQFKYGLRLHSLYLRLKYEQGVAEEDFETVGYALQAYAIYFKRNEEALSKDRIAAYMGLHKFVKKLVDIREKALPVAPDDLLRTLERTEPVPTAADWIRTQILALQPDAPKVGRSSGTPVLQATLMGQ